MSNEDKLIISDVEKYNTAITHYLIYHSEMLNTYMNVLLVDEYATKST